MKFAYLIMAHNEPYVLEKLIRMLDYPDNDIYIHIDEKSQLINKDALYEYSNAIVHAFQGFRAPFSGKIVHIFPEQSAAFN